MLRFGLLSLLALITSGCGELRPPPVPLSALDSINAAAGDGALSSPGRGVRLAWALPPKALLTVHLPDIGGMVRRFKKTSLYRMFTSPEMHDIFGPLSASFSMMSQSAPNGMGAKVMQSLQGEFALSIEDITLGRDGEPESVRLVAALTVGSSVREAEQMLELISMMAASAPGTKVEKGNVGSTPFIRIVATKPQHYVIEMALYRDAFVFGVGREMVTEALTRLQSHGRASIANNPTFRRAMERCADPRDAVRIHIDIAHVMKKFGPLLPEKVMRVMKVLGLDQFQSLTTVARIEGKDIVLSTLLSSPDGKDLLTSMLAANPVDRQFFTRIPADAKSFSLFALDGKRMLAHLRANLQDNLVQDLENALASFGANDFDIERDVFDVFGPRCAVVNLPYGGRDATAVDAIWNQILGTTLVIDVRDPEGARRTLSKLPKSRSDLHWRDYKIDGVSAVSYYPDLRQLPKGFAPSYALVDDFLVVTLAEDTLRHMLKARSPMTSKRYREMFHGMPATVATLSYDDTRQGLGLMMSGFLASMQQHIPGSTRMNPASIAALTRDFNPSLSYTVADNTGIFMHTRSPTAGFGGLGGVTGLLMVAAIAIPNFTVARRTANEQAAVSTLRALHAAQMTFRANVVRDDDGDGEGEFGFLSELLGRRRESDRKSRQHASLVSGFKQDKNGNLVSHGYRFRVYLPAEDGSPVGGHEKASRMRHVDGDLAEAVMVIVAWPIESPGTGRHAYFMDAGGHIYMCSDSRYGGDKAPPPDLLSSQAGNLASEPRIPSPKGRARDGQRWVLLR